MARRLLCSLYTAFALCALVGTSASCNTSSSSGPSQNTTEAVGADPLIAYQWYLFSDGGSAAAAFSAVKGGENHANILAVHDKLNITGTGITVNVVDSGLQLTHPDLRTNQNNSFDYLEQDNNPQPIGSDGDHGTSVAGIIGMKKNNAIGGVGVAPGVTLIGHAFVERVSALELRQYAVMMGLDSFAKKATDIAQVYNQSFGLSANSLTLSSSTTDLTNQEVFRFIYETGTQLGRGKKGYIYVKSAGNGYQHRYEDSEGNGVYYSCNSGETSCTTSSDDFTNTLPENITVSATNAAGKLTSYSTTGAGVWLSAPGGEFGFGDIGLNTSGGLGIWKNIFENTEYSVFLHPAMVTTDVTSCTAGYSQIYPITEKLGDLSIRNLFEYSLTRAHSLNSSCDYTSTFNGTSSSAPVVSGVVALMLQANPRLGWRDVKHILATTSDRIDKNRSDFVHPKTNVTTDHRWTTNAANHSFSNHYGFGQVNGYNAVIAARDYSNDLTDYTADVASSRPLNVSIPDNSSIGASNSLELKQSLSIESTRVTVTITKGSPFDLTLVLESPAGTSSSLLASGSAYKPDTDAGVTYASTTSRFSQTHSMVKAHKEYGRSASTTSITASPTQKLHFPTATKKVDWKNGQ